MEDKKISTSEKVGYFFLALVPFVIYWVLQFGVTIAFMIPRMNSEIFNALQTGNIEPYMKIVEEISPPATIVMHILMSFIFGLWYFFSRSKNTENKFKFRRKIILITFITALSMSVMSNTTVLIQQLFFPDVVEKYEEMVEMSGMGVNFLMIIAASCLAPIGEELLCRGITLMYAQKAFPFWIANIMQALIFGIMHLNWVQGTYAFLIGLILGYTVKKYNSIIPAMIIHFFVNTVAGVISSAIFSLIPVNTAFMIIMIIISLMAVILSFAMIRRDNK